jgi:hypothetical protein
MSWVKVYLDPATQLTEQEAIQYAESRYQEVPYTKWPVSWEAITTPRKQPWNSWEGASKSANPSNVGWHPVKDKLRLPVPFFASTAKSRFKYAVQLVKVTCKDGEKDNNGYDKIDTVDSVLGQYVAPFGDGDNWDSSVREVFDLIDADHSGSLDASEFAALAAGSEHGLGTDVNGVMEARLEMLQILEQESSFLPLSKETQQRTFELENPMSPWAGQKKTKVRKQGGRRMSIRQKSQLTGEQIGGSLSIAAMCGLKELQWYIITAGTCPHTGQIQIVHGAMVDSSVRSACIDIYTNALYMLSRGSLQTKDEDLKFRKLDIQRMLLPEQAMTDEFNFRVRKKKKKKKKKKNGANLTDISGVRFDTVLPNATYAVLPDELIKQAYVCRELGSPGEREEGVRLFRHHQDGRSGGNDGGGALLRHNTYMGEAQLNDIYSNWRVYTRYYRHHLLGAARGGDEIMATYEAKAWERARAQARAEEDERIELTENPRKSSRGSDRGGSDVSVWGSDLESLRSASPVGSLDGFSFSGGAQQTAFGNGAGLGPPPPTSPDIRRNTSVQPERGGVKYSWAAPGGAPFQLNPMQWEGGGSEVDKAKSNRRASAIAKKGRHVKTKQMQRQIFVKVQAMSAAGAETAKARGGKGKEEVKIAMAEDAEGTQRLLQRLAQSDWAQTQEKSSKEKKGAGSMGRVTAGEINPEKR